MASLTESFLISELIHNKINDKHYDTVYLCIEKTTDNKQIINGFNCYSFKNVTQADNYAKKLVLSNDRRITLIPICKWIPTFFHKYILNKKLSEFYWKPNISLYRHLKHSN